MLRLAFQGLRGRKGPFAGAFVALAVAAALVMACASLLQAGLTSKSPVERYAGAPLIVSGDQNVHINPGTDNEDSVPLFERRRIPASLTSKVRAVPGVRKAIADVGVPAAVRVHGRFVEGPGGHATSLHPWPTAALTPYRLSAGRAPRGGDEIVVDAGLAARGRLHAGQHVVLASNGPARVVTVAGIARTHAAVERQGVIFAADAAVRRLANVPGRIDAIGLLPRPGVDLGELKQRVHAAVGKAATVHSGSARGDVEHLENIEAREAVSAIGGTFGGIALVIAMFVVASTIGLSVLLREREMALLRAVAATPKQVRRMIRWETLLVALVASLVGVVPGAALANELGGALSDRAIAPEDMKVTISALPVVVAVASSILTAVLAVAAAGRRASRVRPTQALQESVGSRRLIGPFRAAAGLGTVGVALAFLALAGAAHDPNTVADLATGASFALVIAAALLGPLVVRVVAAFASVALARSQSSVSAFLAISNMRTAAGRFASAVTPLILTVGISSTLLFSGTTREHATAAQERERVTADLVLQSDNGIPRSALEAARDMRGVETAVGIAQTTLGPGLGSTYTPTQAVVVDPHRLGDVLDLNVTAGSVAALGNHSVALSKGQAAGAGAHVGDSVSVTLGDGTRTRARVAAIYKRGLGLGDVVLPTPMGQGHLTSPLLSSALVRAERGHVADVARRLHALLRSYPGVSVGDRHDHAARADHDRETNNWLFRILSGIIFVFTGVAVVNTVIMIALHRRRELALLRLVGGTRRQIIAMARWEGLFTVGLGLLVGGGIALITLVPTAAAISGSARPYAPTALVALVFGSAAAVGLLATQLSTRVALRPRPIEGMGIRD